MSATRPSVAVIHHLERPSLGHAAGALRDAGVHVDERRLRDGDPLPGLAEHDGLVVLGGEQSVAGIACEPMLQAVAALLRDAVDRRVPVLGVCLGAQLLAHALGAGVAPLPRRLVEWVALEPLPAAAGDPVLGALPDGAHGLHWNEDGFDVPAGGAVELLARRGSGRCVAFRARDAPAWGVQFHPEADEALLADWYTHWSAAPGEAGITEAAARASDDRYLAGQSALSAAIVGGFASVVVERARAGVPALEHRSSRK